MMLNISSTASSMIPGQSSAPVMVWVFPDDVCPYANIVPGKDAPILI